MLALVLRRVLWMVPGFLGITLVVFAILRAAPGDPVALAMGDTLQANGSAGRAVAVYRQQMGLDEPVVPAYVKWLGHLAKGDLGRSIRDGQPVLKKLATALPITLALSLASILITYAIAIPLGIFSAVRAGSMLERALSLALFLLYSMPSQWVAFLLIVLLGTRWNWLPIQGLHSEGNTSLLDLLRHVALPLLCLTYATFASVSRYMRTGMLEVLRQDYIRTARAKGLSESTVILRHALRNGLTSIVTLVGLTLPTLVGGAVIVERIFGLPGMGQLSFDAISTKDIPVLMGATVLSGVLTMVGLLVSDLLQMAVDPRVRSEGR